MVNPNVFVPKDFSEEIKIWDVMQSAKIVWNAQIQNLVNIQAVLTLAQNLILVVLMPSASCNGITESASAMLDLQENLIKCVTK
jgi:hypothetical protein